MISKELKDFNEMDEMRMSGIKSLYKVDRETEFMKKNNIKLKQFTVSVDEIKISKSENYLFFPVFEEVESNLKCLRDEEMYKMILIIEKTSKNLVYLNSDIIINYENIGENEILVPKYTLRDDSPVLIIYPINSRYFNNGVLQYAHSSIIIVNTLSKSISYFDSIGKKKIETGILQVIMKNLFAGYVFINEDVELIDIDGDLNDYFTNIDDYKGLCFKKNDKMDVDMSVFEYMNDEFMDIDHDDSNIISDDDSIDNNVQVIQEMGEFFNGLGGFCVGWSLYIVYITLININIKIDNDTGVSVTSLVDNLLLKNGSPDILSGIIRRFTSYVLKFNTLNSGIIKNINRCNKVLRVKFDRSGLYEIMSKKRKNIF